VSSVEYAGSLVLTQRPQVEGEVAGRAQRVGVVFAQHSATPTHGVLAELASRLVFTQRAQIVGKVMSRTQRVGMVLAQHPAIARQGVLAQYPGPPVITQRGPLPCAAQSCAVPRSPSPAAQGVQRRRIEHSTLIVIGHGGPLFVGVTWRSSDTYHQAGIE
jgi:hypothetical protein